MASIGIADKNTLDAVKSTVDEVEVKADTIIDKIDNLDIGGGGGSTDLSNIQIFVLDYTNDEMVISAGAVDDVKRRLTI